MTHDDALALLAAIAALAPGLVTDSQAGCVAGDEEAIENGFIKLATSDNKGLMPAAYAALLGSPEALAFIGGKALTQTAGFHNSLYRGKYLGSSVTEAQRTAISAGTFDDLFIGDYWAINDVNWRIAAFDYWYNMGSPRCTAHHVVIVPDICLAQSKMNNTDTTAGAYVGSDWYTGSNSNAGKSTANAAINSAFGADYILRHREYLKNAVTNGYESAGAWYDSTFELMTEQMVYGGKVFGNVLKNIDTPVNATIGLYQLPLFAHDPSSINIGAFWWLRDVGASTHFAAVTQYGTASLLEAADTFGIRPAFGIRG